MTGVTIGEYLSFSATHGVSIGKAALELDPAELHRIVTCAPTTPLATQAPGRNERDARNNMGRRGRAFQTVGNDATRRRYVASHSREPIWR